MREFMNRVVEVLKGNVGWLHLDCLPCSHPRIYVWVKPLISEL